MASMAMGETAMLPVMAELHIVGMPALVRIVYFPALLRLTKIVSFRPRMFGITNVMSLQAAASSRANWMVLKDNLMV
jgi:hypothetical protein